MSKIIGEVTTVKTNIVTGEQITHVERNTQLLGLFQNLSEVTNAPLFYDYERSSIYISDNNIPLNRLFYSVNTTAQTFSVGGSSISGEYWPQYSNDTDQKRVTITFKERFSPGSSTRTIRTIALYSYYYSRYMAALQLQTPCIQTNLDILDIYYKIYVDYSDIDNLEDYNVNKEFIIQNNILTRWFYSGSSRVYYEGTNTRVTGSGGWSGRLGLMPLNTDLNDHTAVYENTGISNDGYWTFPTVSPSSTRSNASQGTTICEYSMGTNNYVGYLINKVATMRWDYRYNSSGYARPVSATYVLGGNDSRVQSVYLKNANSDANSVIPYLDPSYIGSSTAELILDDSEWDEPWKPTMMRINIIDGGDINSAQYTVSIRHSFGFNNHVDSEFPIRLTNIFDRAAVSETIHNKDIGSYKLACKRIDECHVVSSSNSGITIINVYTGNYQNYDDKSTPSIESTQIQDAVPLPDGSILIPTLDVGLLKLSADRTTVTQFSGIGDDEGITEHLCYAVAPKFNGDFWAMFEGGLAKYSNSTGEWTVYNTTTPIQFNPSAYVPNWSNTLALFCKEDGDEDQIAIIGLANTAITWWSPSSPTAVTTSGSANSIWKFGNSSEAVIRGKYNRIMRCLPGTNKWYFPNANSYTAMMDFGSTTATQIGSASLSSYASIILKPTNKNGIWEMMVYENQSPSSSGSVANLLYSHDGTTKTLLGTVNTYISFNSNSYDSIIEVMDDYGVVVGGTTNSYTRSYLYSLLSSRNSNSWKTYGWNSTTNEWELNNSAGKPVHEDLQTLPNGVKCAFSPTGTNDFITNEHWLVYLYDGLHKDNSTTATFRTAVQSRKYYYTEDLSNYTVPTMGLGEVTEDFNVYTCPDDNAGAGIGSAYAWKGAVSAAGYDSNSVANSLKSELLLTGDFTFDFWATHVSGNNDTYNTMTWIGLYDVASPVSSKWAFRFNSTGYAVSEDDTLKTSVVLPTQPSKYSIKRIGNTLTYYVDDVLIYTSMITNTGTLRGIFRMPSSDAYRTFYDMKVTYEEDRPVLKIGSPVNQTGIYDPNYAMIEAWLTNPRTAEITIDGTPANIITNPTLTPEPGEVLLLQKSGWLVFNPLDAGKPVTCKAMVLLET